MEGWVKYYRCIEEDEIWQDPHRLRFWLWLLSHASYKDSNKNYIQSINMYIPVNIGQLAVSQSTLADKFGVHRHTLSKWLEELTEQEKIMTTTNRKYTIITIINYKKYQFNDGTQKEENNGQANIQDNNQINSKLNTFNDNQHGQVNGQVHGQVNGQVYNIKESKEIKNNNSVCVRARTENEKQLEDLKNDRQYQETYAMQNHLTLEQVGQLIEAFGQHLILGGDEAHRTKAEFISHFRDWARYRIEEQNKTNYRQNENQSDKYARRRGTAPSPLEEFKGESF